MAPCSNGKSSCGSASAAGGARGRAGRSARRRRARGGSRTTRCSTTERESLRARTLRAAGPHATGARSILTFKGPVAAGPMKLREELETVVADGDPCCSRPRAARPARLVPVSEVPRGVRARRRRRSRSTRRRSAPSSRLRAPRPASCAAAAALGRTPADFILDSYCGLFVKYREALGFRGTRHDLRRPRSRAMTDAAAPPRPAATRGRPWSSPPGWARACAPLSDVARQTRAPGRRRAAGRTHPALARRRRRRATRCSTCTICPATITAAIGDGGAFGVRVRYSWEPRRPRQRGRPGPRAAAARRGAVLPRQRRHADRRRSRGRWRRAHRVERRPRHAWPLDRRTRTRCTTAASSVDQARPRHRVPAAGPRQPRLAFHRRAGRRRVGVRRRSTRTSPPNTVSGIYQRLHRERARGGAGVHRPAPPSATSGRRPTTWTTSWRSAARKAAPDALTGARTEVAPGARVTRVRRCGMMSLWPAPTRLDRLRGRRRASASRPGCACSRRVVWSTRADVAAGPGDELVRRSAGRRRSTRGGAAARERTDSDMTTLKSTPDVAAARSRHGVPRRARATGDPRRSCCR